MMKIPAIEINDDGKKQITAPSLSANLLITHCGNKSKPQISTELMMVPTKSCINKMRMDLSTDLRTNMNFYVMCIPFIICTRNNLTSIRDIHAKKTFSVFFTMVSRRVPLTTMTLTSNVPSTSPAFGFDATEASPRVQTFSNKVNELETRFKKSSSKRRLLKKNKKKTFAKENFVKKILRGPPRRRMNSNTTLNSSISKLRWVKIPFVKLILKKKE